MKIEYIFALVIIGYTAVYSVFYGLIEYIKHKNTDNRLKAVKKACRHIQRLEGYAEFVAIADAYNDFI